LVFLVFSNNALPTSLSCGFFSFKYLLTQLLGAPRSSTPAWCMTMGPRALLNKNPLAICS
ncbi:mCG1033976, partial [Mus musculus]